MTEGAVLETISGGSGGDHVRTSLHLGPAASTVGGAVRTIVEGNGGNDDLGFCVAGLGLPDLGAFVVDRGDGFDVCQATPNVLLINGEG